MLKMVKKTCLFFLYIVFFFNFIIVAEFEPELCPKWETLSEILRNEIPSQIIASIVHKPHVLDQPIKVLVLCQDSRTCHQLNQYLTQGGERYLLFTAMKNDVTIGSVSEQYQMIREADGNSLKIQNAMDFVSTFLFCVCFY